MTTGQQRYREYLKSPDWQKKRSKKRAKRDRCAVCGDTQHLDVHHLNYRNWTDVLLSDLRVLCRRCHTLAHELMNRGVIRFKAESSHQSRFAITKNAIRREIGDAGMHWQKEQSILPRSWRGGYTRTQLAEWGVPWPPPKGWKKQLERRVAAVGA